VKGSFERYSPCCIHRRLENKQGALVCTHDHRLMVVGSALRLQLLLVGRNDEGRTPESN